MVSLTSRIYPQRIVAMVDPARETLNQRVSHKFLLFYFLKNDDYLWLPQKKGGRLRIGNMYTPAVGLYSAHGSESDELHLRCEIIAQGAI